jgi:hypothetical protein
MLLSPESEVLSFAGIFLFYKLPFRAADKAITSGPDATTNARTASCAITSRFISSTSKTFFNKKDSSFFLIQYWWSGMLRVHPRVVGSM